MVSYGDLTVEIQSEEVDEEGRINISAHAVLPCGECGEELKENDFELEEEIEHECDPAKVKCHLCGHPHEDHPEGGKCQFPSIEVQKTEICGTPATMAPVDKNPCPCPAFVETEEKGFEMELEEPEPMEDYRPKTTKSKKGVEKPVPMRYQKHYFGVQVSGTLTCNRCGKEITFEMKDDEQSSSFSDLV
jgi:hypothetical protein